MRTVKKQHKLLKNVISLKIIIITTLILLINIGYCFDDIGTNLKDVKKLRHGYHKNLTAIENIIVIKHVVKTKGVLIFNTKSREMFHFEGILKKGHNNTLIILDNQQLMILKKKER